MLRLSRPFQASLLCVLLVLTGQSMAVARGAMASGGQMVICSGAGPVTVHVDAQGNPTTAPRVCPDCVLTLQADATLIFEEIETTTSRAVYAGLQDWLIGQVSAPRGFRPRAPPIGI
jgi:hypothetical protein